MKILISDAVAHFKTQAKLAEVLDLHPQSITNRKRRSEYLTETQALKLRHLFPGLAKVLIAQAKNKE